MKTIEKRNESKIRDLTDAEVKHVSGGAPPAQGSGKNEAGHKVDVFAGNPHDRPGANAKETP